MLLISIIAGTILIFIGFVLYINSTNEKVTTNKKNDKQITNSVADKREEWSLNNQTLLAQKAIEEYSQQSISETTESRKERLLKYFTKDSPVLEYENVNLVSPITDSSAASGPVEYCEEQEGGHMCLLVSVDTTLSSSTEKNSLKQNYWITIIKDEGNAFKVFDLGLVE